MTDHVHVPPTEAELNELSTLMLEASKRPWYSGDNPGAYIVCITHPDAHLYRGLVVGCGRCDVSTYWAATGIGGMSMQERQANADLIAMAVNHLPFWLAEAREAVRLRKWMAAMISKRHSDRTCSLEAQGLDPESAAEIQGIEHITNMAINALAGKEPPK